MTKRVNGVSGWPLAAALLNLNGLGVGYLYLQQGLRWLLHFAGTVLLVAGALLLTPLPPGLWWLLLVGWVGWMTWDGWQQAQRLKAAYPKEYPGPNFLALPIALLFGLVVLAIFWQYNEAARRAYTSGTAAYQAGDCAGAIQTYAQLGSFYRFSSNSAELEAAQTRQAECKLWQSANAAKERGAFGEAIDGYEAYLKQYPGQRFATQAASARLETYSAWGDALKQSKDYASALDKYKVVLADQSGGPLVPKVRVSTALLYNEWAADNLQKGNFSQATEYYDTVLKDFADTPAFNPAQTGLAEAYTRWATQKKDTGNFSEAVSTYEGFVKKYPNHPALGTMRGNLAEVYYVWGGQLKDKGSQAEALDKYNFIIQNYGDTPAVHKANASVNEIYFQAVQLGKTGKPCEAMTLFENIIKIGKTSSKEARDNLPDTLINCAFVSYQKGNETEANRLYDRVIAEFPNHPAAAKAKTTKQDIETAKARPAAPTQSASGSNPFSSSSAGRLPQPPVSGSAPAGTTIIALSNNTSERLEIVLSGPASQTVILEPCQGCGSSSSSSCSSQAPTKELRLAPNTYQVTARVLTRSNVRQFSGSWSLANGMAYSTCFYFR